MPRPVVSRFRLRPWSLAAATWLAALGQALPATAQTPFGPDPDIGYDLAARVCSACHLVEPRHAGPVVDGVPSLMRIAATRDDAEIETLLSAPSHPAMPEAPLNREERDHLLAYIRTLKSDREPGRRAKKKGRPRVGRPGDQPSPAARCRAVANHQPGSSRAAQKR